MYRNETHLNQIVRAWFQKAMQRDDQGDYIENPITRFVFLWFSFNAFYSNTLIKILKENERKQRYRKNGDLDSPSEKTVIEISMRRYSHHMKEWIQSPGFVYFRTREKIKDMYPGRQGDSLGYGNGQFNPKTGRVKGGNIYSENEHEQLIGYLNILYTIRCNLFHGQKRCYSEDDLEIIENACLCLSDIVQVVQLL